MGCYDTVIVKCPQCGEPESFQSKSGLCCFDAYSLDECPADILLDVSRHAPYSCYKCGTKFWVEYETYRPDRHSFSVRNVRVVSEKNTPTESGAEPNSQPTAPCGEGAEAPHAESGTSA